MLTTVVGLMVAATTSCAPETSSPLTPDAEAGRMATRTLGCAACHGQDGEGVEGLGPSWQGLFGTEVVLADGTTVVADREYLRRSIEEPDAQTVSGFTLPMPPYQLSPADMEAILVYLESQG